MFILKFKKEGTLFFFAIILYHIGQKINGMARKKNFLIILLSAVLFFPLAAAADGLVPCGGDEEVPCELCHFFVMFKNIIEFLLIKIVPPLAVLLVAWGGMLYIFSADNPANIAKANSIFKSVAIALIIIYASWLMISLFLQVIGIVEWTGLLSWWEISDCPE